MILLRRVLGVIPSKSSTPLAGFLLPLRSIRLSPLWFIRLSPLRSIRLSPLRSLADLLRRDRLTVSFILLCTVCKGEEMQSFSFREALDLRWAGDWEFLFLKLYLTAERVGSVAKICLSKDRVVRFSWEESVAIFPPFLYQTINFPPESYKHRKPL
ncbi:hypothetical protein GDO86_013206 [Hymenochirus boettgeri]|uniref:Uncharacterized protein n=1 Tax=Hymenochirus boettgeri TaxID=247094 RepID=A0A8T2IVT5_9PIPI|nr:hypothetical protein GDO86_013206 [Hymenochirus boettgeri]